MEGVAGRGRIISCQVHYSPVLAVEEVDSFVRSIAGMNDIVRTIQMLLPFNKVWFNLVFFFP